MLANFGYILIFLLVGAAFVGLNVVIAILLSPYAPSEEKSKIYDCGERAIGTGFVQFNMRFYLVALVFVIFDVEIAFMYPITAVFKEMLFSGWGWLAFVEISLFVIILLVGFVYAWSVGGLDWVRKETGTKEGS